MAGLGGSASLRRQHGPVGTPSGMWCDLRPSPPAPLRTSACTRSRARHTRSHRPHAAKQTHARGIRTRTVTHVLPHPLLAGKSTAAGHATLPQVHDGKMWVVGGDIYNDSNDVWCLVTAFR